MIQAVEEIERMEDPLWDREHYPKKLKSKGNYQFHGQEPIHDRYNTQPGNYGWDGIEFKDATARTIERGTGKVLFEMKDAIFPTNFSQNAIDQVSDKYFKKAGINDERDPTGVNYERSFVQLVDRITYGISDWGGKNGYFANEKEMEIFRDELTNILANQRAFFNSPVNFNVGLDVFGLEGTREDLWVYDEEKQEGIVSSEGYQRPQGSACFIVSVEDSMDSILEREKTEGNLFKYGSGCGTNNSTLRYKGAKLSEGGEASGPVSFLGIYDSGAKAIKSGGKTRRAAKMEILNGNHPDMVEFIKYKAEHELEYRILTQLGGMDDDWEGQAKESLPGQNANYSIRVKDDWMKAVEEGGLIETEWKEETVRTYKANEVWDLVAEATRICGDPGIQFDDTVNKWNPVLDTKRINATNPCSEYMFVDDSACNLASHNLLKYYDDETGKFDSELFKKDVGVMITAMEIICGKAGYPAKEIAENSYKYRPLGLGYANLGALLMTKGLAYDSDEGRSLCGAITAIMGGEAYAQSARLANTVGAFECYKENKSSFSRVINQHKEAVEDIVADSDELVELKNVARKTWQDAQELGQQFGYRNAQATVLAPTGTIAFAMDCDTTGIEPDLALVKTKKLAGGGTMRIVNNSVPHGLKNLGYDNQQTVEIMNHIAGHRTLENAPYVNPEALKQMGYKEEQILKLQDMVKTRQELPYDAIQELKLADKLTPSQLYEAEVFVNGHGTIANAPHLKEEHYEVFNTSFKMPGMIHAIKPEAHIDMMAAAQPFLSGAISKTVNLSSTGNEEEDRKNIQEAYMRAWKKGLKAVAVYLDGSKGSQPLNVASTTLVASGKSELGRGDRERPNFIRNGIREKVKIDGVNFFVSTGEYADGRLAEVFIDASYDHGTEAEGEIRHFAKMTSKALQHGMPLEKVVDDLMTFRHGPQGSVSIDLVDGKKTAHPYIKGCKSWGDFMGRWIAMHYQGRTDEAIIHVKPDHVDPDYLRINQINKQNEAMRLFQTAENIGRLRERLNMVEHLSKKDVDEFKEAKSKNPTPASPVNRLTMFASEHSNGHTKTEEDSRIEEIVYANTYAGGKRCGCGAMMHQLNAHCWQCNNCGDDTGGGCGF